MMARRKRDVKWMLLEKEAGKKYTLQLLEIGKKDLVDKSTTWTLVDRQLDLRSEEVKIDESVGLGGEVPCSDDRQRWQGGCGLLFLCRSALMEAKLEVSEEGKSAGQ
ncbi:hypothetical protein LWI29_037385 [Acer saccharum]|uniref:Uncharacterized protein n=1 Tax=Acer saccharum TaxID=4024 RepID=A0AA39W661_ACESA|nr:hypothetical protein LWI29_037385 [Acer saccharum]